MAATVWIHAGHSTSGVTGYMEQTLIGTIVTKKPQYHQDSPSAFKFEALSSPLGQACEGKIFFVGRFFGFFVELNADHLPDSGADSRIGFFGG